MATKNSFSIWHILPVVFTMLANLFAYAFLTDWVESTSIVWVVLAGIISGLGVGQLCEKIGKYDSPLFSVYLPTGMCIVFLGIQLLSQ